MEKLFREFLISEGYSVITPTGKKSTVDAYLSAVKYVSDLEGCASISDLQQNIHSTVAEYDIGGSKESTGMKSHNTVISALRAFARFADEVCKA